MFIKSAKFILSPAHSVVYVFFYPCLVFVISTLSTVVEIPDFFYPEYIAEIFAKYVWFHMTLKLLAFALCTQYTLTAGRVFQVLPVCVRLALNLAFTFVGKFFMDYLSALYGECSNNNYATAYNCVKNGFTWTSRTLPLTCFLTFYGMLVLLEETKIYKDWEEIEDVIQRKYELDIVYGSNLRTCGSFEAFVIVEKVIALYGKSAIIVKITYCVLAIIMVLLHIANITIILYIRTPPMVVVATLVAVFFWLVTYRFIYRVELCNFKMSIHRTEIEEYVQVAERDTEKNNAIEEIVARNDIKPKDSPRTNLLSRFYTPHSYSSL